MSLEITPEQLLVQETVEELIAKSARPRPARAVPSAIDRGLWRGLSSLGLAAVSVPEADGGPGGSLLDQVLVAEALGAGVASVPAVTAPVAARVLARIGCPAADALLADMLDGSTVAQVAVSAATGLVRLPETGSTEITDLVEGAFADVLIVPQPAGNGLRWFALRPADRAEFVRAQPSLDFCSPLGLARLGADGAELVGTSGPELLEEARLTVMLLVAASALGASSKALDMSVDYAKVREQFGRPIGAFQAVKHKLVDMLIDVQNFRSVVYGAAAGFSLAAESAMDVLLAKALADECGVSVVQRALQVHGGIGFTWEHDLHLLLRRVKSCSLALGSSPAHYDLIADELQKRLRVGTAVHPVDALIDTAGDVEFHRELVEWLDANLPLRRDEKPRLPRDPDERRELLRSWQASLADARWVAIHWPEEYGGRSATLSQQLTYHAELAARYMPPLPGHRGISIVGPTLIRHGTPEQRERFLNRIRRGDDLWAGGFSEPEAGSDLASLRTRAVLHGEKFIVNGQKVWTSSAHWSDWIYTLVRTAPDEKKHEGISVLLIPLDSPGVSIRPIRQLTGESRFNEVFFDSVEVPVQNLVGPLNRGWDVSRTTLAHEHFTLFIPAQMRFARTLDELIALADRLPDATFGTRLRNPDVRQRVARLWGNSRGLVFNGLRNIAEVSAGGDPGPGGSIMKVFGQESEQRLFELGIDITGPSGLLDRGAQGAIDKGKWLFGYLAARAATIGGGTSEIHRNKVAENVLGLPRERAEAQSE